MNGAVPSSSPGRSGVRRGRATRSIASAIQGSEVPQARYLHGRAAKSMTLWRGWDEYNSYLRQAVLAAYGNRPSPTCPTMATLCHTCPRMAGRRLPAERVAERAAELDEQVRPACIASSSTQPTCMRRTDSFLIWQVRPGAERDRDGGGLRFTAGVQPAADDTATSLCAYPPARPLGPPPLTPCR